jgi:hypothetical protein
MMMRLLAGCLVVVLVGLPVLASPVWPARALAGAGGVLCGAGVMALSMPTVAAGMGLSLIAYTLGAWLSDSPVSVYTPVAIGIVVALLLGVAAFAARFQDAWVDPRVLRTQVLEWIWTAALAGLAGVGLGMSAGGVRLALPSWGHPVLALVGVLLAVIGAMRTLMAPADDPGGNR